MSSQKGNNLAKYGQDVQKLQRAIKANQNKFKLPPVGPVGSHIKMREGQKGSTTVRGLHPGTRCLPHLF